MSNLVILGVLWDVNSFVSQSGDDKIAEPSEMFRVRESRLKWLDGRSDEFISTEMWDFDFVMMVMNGLRKSFDFINLGEWDNLLSNMNMIHTESCIGLIIREELLIHDRG